MTKQEKELDKELAELKSRIPSFDIIKHKWSDDRLDVFENLKRSLTIESEGLNHFKINKDDAIAIAKHFKLLPNLDKGTIVVDPGVTIKVTDSEGLAVSLDWQEDI